MIYLKYAAILAHIGRYEFSPAALKVVPEWPLVYWWSDELLARYASVPKFQRYCTSPHWAGDRQ